MLAAAVQHRKAAFSPEPGHPKRIRDILFRVIPDRIDKVASACHA